MSNFEYLKKIKNQKIIVFDSCFFCYVEDKEYITPHPFDDYYFKINDISVNVFTSLKWSAYCYYFLKSISETMNEINNSSKNIYSLLPSDIKYESIYNKHVLYIDDVIIEDMDAFISVLNNEYNSEFFEPNTKVRFKLKINLNDFILLQNCFLPTIYFF